MKNYKWTENGENFSMWEIAPGIYTGDGGAKEYQKLLSEEINKIPEISGESLYEYLKKLPPSNLNGKLTKEKLEEIISDIFKLNNNE